MRSHLAPHAAAPRVVALRLVVIALLCAVLTPVTMTHLGCAKAPPELLPPAKQAFYKERVLKVLDLVRDFAIDGEATDPKVVTTTDTRHIVEWHASTVKIMLAADSGWVPAVTQSLDEVETKLSPATRPKVRPYFTLVKTVLQEVSR